MTNRVKGLDLIDRVPEELWMEVCDFIQEAVIKTIPKKKKCMEKEMATPSSILAWKIPWIEESVRLQYMGWQRVGHDLATEHACVHTHTQAPIGMWV